MDAKVTIPALAQMKRDGRKIVGVVAWDYQIARIADRAGVDIISVGDTVGINLWGHATPLEVTLDEMVIVCRAVRRDDPDVPILLLTAQDGELDTVVGLDAGSRAATADRQRHDRRCKCRSQRRHHGEQHRVQPDWR